MSIQRYNRRRGSSWLSYVTPKNAYYGYQYAKGFYNNYIKPYTYSRKKSYSKPTPYFSNRRRIMRRSGRVGNRYSSTDGYIHACGAKIRSLIFNYSREVDVDTATGTPFASFPIRCNSIFDPEYLTGGGQPQGYDEWSSLYQQYVVVKSHIKIVPILKRIPNTTAGSNDLVYYYGIHLGPASGQSSFTTEVAQYTSPALISANQKDFQFGLDMTNPQALGNPTANLRGSSRERNFDTAKWYGVITGQKITDENDLQGLMGASGTGSNPANADQDEDRAEPLFTIWVWNSSNATTEPAITFYVNVTYHVKLLSPFVLDKDS